MTPTATPVQELIHLIETAQVSTETINSVLAALKNLDTLIARLQAIQTTKKEHVTDYRHIPVNQPNQEPERYTEYAIKTEELDALLALFNTNPNPIKEQNDDKESSL